MDQLLEVSRQRASPRGLVQGREQPQDNNSRVVVAAAVPGA